MVHKWTLAVPFRGPGPASSTPMAAHGRFNCSCKDLTLFSDCCMHMVPRHTHRQVNYELMNLKTAYPKIRWLVSRPAALWLSHITAVLIHPGRHCFFAGITPRIIYCWPLDALILHHLVSLAVFTLLTSSHNLRMVPSLIRHVFPQTTSPLSSRSSTLPLKFTTFTLTREKVWRVLFVFLCL